MGLVPAFFFAYIIASFATGQDSGICYNRFEYEYNILQKLVMLDWDRTRMNETIAYLLNANAQLQQRLAETTQLLEAMNATVTTLRRDGTPEGTSYIRWGRTVCPSGAGAELFYDGFAAGGHNTHTGGGTNYLCLPRDPDFAPLISGNNRGYVYGAEYETGGSMWEHVFDNDVPCAVCRIPRTNLLMIPGKNQCHEGWLKEYSGFLMTGHYNHAGPKEHVCMDAEPETLNAGTGDKDGALFYLVDARCGSLKCPPYEEFRELTCAVCSYTGS